MKKEFPGYGAGKLSSRGDLAGELLGTPEILKSTYLGATVTVL
jgi:hypothetical protein